MLSWEPRLPIVFKGRVYVLDDNEKKSFLIL